MKIVWLQKEGVVSEEWEHYGTENGGGGSSSSGKAVVRVRVKRRESSSHHSKRSEKTKSERKKVSPLKPSGNSKKSTRTKKKSKTKSRSASEAIPEAAPVVEKLVSFAEFSKRMGLGGATKQASTEAETTPKEQTVVKEEEKEVTTEAEEAEKEEQEEEEKNNQHNDTETMNDKAEQPRTKEEKVEQTNDNKEDEKEDEKEEDKENEKEVEAEEEVENEKEEEKEEKSEEETTEEEEEKVESEEEEEQQQQQKEDQEESSDKSELDLGDHVPSHDDISSSSSSSESTEKPRRPSQVVFGQVNKRPTLAASSPNAANRRPKSATLATPKLLSSGSVVPRADNVGPAELRAAVKLLTGVLLLDRTDAEHPNEAPHWAACGISNGLIHLCAAGCGGVDGVTQNIRSRAAMSDMVMMMLRVCVTSSYGPIEKVVLLEYVPATVRGVRRARLHAHRTAVRDIFGFHNLVIDVADEEDLHVDLFEKLLRSKLV